MEFSEGTSIGHIRTDLQPVIVEFGRPAVIVTQAIHGGERLGTTTSTAVSLLSRT
jgi:hypothetical protein